MLQDGNELESAVVLACLLEATARKPGNVHPAASFADCAYGHFVESAFAVGSVLANSQPKTVGESIEAAVTATVDRVGQNTNLGIVLLLAPLCAAAHGDEASLHQRVDRVLKSLTVDDAVCAYNAIRRAQPGGLGSADGQDVANAPDQTLLECMRLAADRDRIAQEYTDGFPIVFEFLVPEFAAANDFVERWEDTIVRTQLRTMARFPDTLIARKCGVEVSDESARRAQEVLDAGWPNTDGSTEKLREFDGWLRADGHRRNPGTTADLIAAGLFVSIVTGTLNPLPTQEDVLLHAVACGWVHGL